MYSNLGHVGDLGGGGFVGACGVVILLRGLVRRCGGGRRVVSWCRRRSSLALRALLLEALFDFGFSGEGVDGSEENVTY